MSAPHISRPFCYLCAKNYQHWWKFDNVLAKTILHSFFETRCIFIVYCLMVRVSALSSNYRVMASVIVVDAPGFRNPAHCGRSTGATFEDLCHNYVQERLQLLFHDTVFTSKQDLYAQVCTFFYTFYMLGHNHLVL